MKDKEFLSWIADRLVNVYGESTNVDFVHKLRAIVAGYPGDKDTKWHNNLEINDVGDCIYGQMQER